MLFTYAVVPTWPHAMCSLPVATEQCSNCRSEYARLNDGDRGGIIALDLLPIEPIAGVIFLQGDLTEQ